MVAGVSSRVPEVGAVLAGTYRLESTLGEGGFGIVFAAHDEMLDTEVALKLLLAPDNDLATERFLREARLASELESDHVVRVLDMGDYDGQPFLVMERLHG